MKKIISILAALAFVFTLVPVSVFAAQTTEAELTGVAKSINEIFPLGPQASAEDTKISAKGIYPTVFTGNDKKVVEVEGMLVKTFENYSQKGVHTYRFNDELKEDANGTNVLVMETVKEGSYTYIDNWHVEGNFDVYGIIVRGGHNDFNLYAYDTVEGEMIRADEGLYCPYMPNGKPGSISHVTVYFGVRGENDEAEDEIDIKKSEVVTEETEEDPSVDEAVPGEEEVEDEYNTDEEDTAISLDGLSYAYIFGYEPYAETIINEDGKEEEIVKIQMAMDDKLTVDQVCSMLMRLLDQSENTMDETYPVTAETKDHAGQWYERGLNYMFSKGGFKKGETVKLGYVTRGEVAKFVTHALDLNKREKTPFTDIQNSEYKKYIETVYYYGFMNGVGNNEFDPDSYLTRGEICQLINNIIGRNDCDLIALDEEGNEFEITADTYYFVDMDPSHWAYEACLKATSCYDENGYVDLETRSHNMRNKLDNYNAQKKY